MAGFVFNIADLTFDHIKQLEGIYSTYCQRNEHVGRTIRALTKTNQSFAVMVDRCASQMYNLDLNAYRLKPLQRITKFVAL